MRILIALLCFFCATNVAIAQQQEVQTLDFRTLELFEPLPEVMQTAPMEVYAAWARAHNQIAYARAKCRADEFNNRHPVSSVYVIENQYTNLHRTNNFYQPYKSGTVRETYRTYSPKTYGGGPVMVINPYFRN